MRRWHNIEQVTEQCTPAMTVAFHLRQKLAHPWTTLESMVQEGMMRAWYEGYQAGQADATLPDDPGRGELDCPIGAKLSSLPEPEQTRVRNLVYPTAPHEELCGDEEGLE